MVCRTVQLDQLEPIEKASVDELRALQLERLKWSLEHTYNNVQAFREKCDAQGVVPPVGVIKLSLTTTLVNGTFPVFVTFTA